MFRLKASKTTLNLNRLFFLNTNEFRKFSEKMKMLSDILGVRHLFLGINLSSKINLLWSWCSG